MERKTRFVVVVVVFFSPKSTGGHSDLPPKTSEELDMKNFTSAIAYSCPDGLTLVIPFPQPERVYGQTEYADVITKFSRFGR